MYIWTCINDHKCTYVSHDGLHVHFQTPTFTFACFWCMCDVNNILYLSVLWGYVRNLFCVATPLRWYWLLGAWYVQNVDTHNVSHWPACRTGLFQPARTPIFWWYCITKCRNLHVLGCGDICTLTHAHCAHTHTSTHTHNKKVEGTVRVAGAWFAGRQKRKKMHSRITVGSWGRKSAWDCSESLISF